MGIVVARARADDGALHKSEGGRQEKFQGCYHKLRHASKELMVTSLKTFGRCGSRVSFGAKQSNFVIFYPSGWGETEV